MSAGSPGRVAGQRAFPRAPANYEGIFQLGCRGGKSPSSSSSSLPRSPLPLNFRPVHSIAFVRRKGRREGDGSEEQGRAHLTTDPQELQDDCENIESVLNAVMRVLEEVNTFLPLFSPPPSPSSIPQTFYSCLTSLLSAGRRSEEDLAARRLQDGASEVSCQGKDQ